MQVLVNTIKEQPIFQQDLKRCRLRSLPYCASSFFFFLAVFYAWLFCFYGIKNYYAKEYMIRYDDVCTNKSTCRVDINVEESMNPPIYFYYRLTNFKQNHRDIATSYNSDMLRGKLVSLDSTHLKSCAPRVFLNNTNNITNLIVPCGLLPASVFNDTFTVLNGASFDDSNISLQIDSQYNYISTKSTYPSSYNWLEETGIFPGGTGNQHFIVWMRQSAFAPFRKLYGVMNTTLPKGNVTVDIVNNYPTDQFKGEKWIVVTEEMKFGSHKKGAMIVFGFMSAMFITTTWILSFIGWKRAKPTSKFHPNRVKNLFNEPNA